MTSIIAKLTGLALGLTMLLAGAGTAETPVGSNIESRVVLAFKVDDAAATALLPDGWKALTLPQGPFAGANLVVLLADRHLGLDPDGQPTDPFASRYAAFVVYGVAPETKGPRTFVARTYETPPVQGVYGNAVGAKVSRAFSLTGEGSAPRHADEAWLVEAENGDRIAVELNYHQGRPGWSSGESMPYSAATPEFHRIYRFDQLADLAMSAGLGRDLNGEVELEISIPSLFDGTEELRAITVIPVYIRRVSLP